MKEGSVNEGGTHKVEEKHAKTHHTLRQRASELERLASENQKKAAEYFDQLQRMQADFINYKKIVEREKAETIKYANENLILSLLDVMESLDKAVESCDESQRGISDGLRKVSSGFHRVLESQGLFEVKTVGEKFNTKFHEAIDTRVSGTPEGVIVEEIQKGYTLKDKILRPAKVIVSVKSKKRGFA